MIRKAAGLSTTADTGSGTVMGVALMMLMAVSLAAVACVGNLLVCQANARSAADTAAVSAASALAEGDPDPCSIAYRILHANAARPGQCKVVDEDVSVDAVMSTAVPFIPVIARSSRAGPVMCE